MTEELLRALDEMPEPTPFDTLDSIPDPSPLDTLDALEEPAAPASTGDMFGAVMGQAFTGARAAAKESTPGQILQEGAKGVFRGTAGLTEAGANLVSAFGESLGADDFALDARAYAEGVGAYKDRAFPRAAPANIEEIIERGDAQDYVNWAAATLGEQVPVVASIFAGGGAGVGAGRLAQQLANGRFITPAQASALAQKFATTGGVAGATTVGLGLNTAETVEEQRDAELPLDLSTALTAGAVKTSLDALPVAAFARKLGIGGDVAGDLLGRIAKRIDAMGTGKLAFVGGTAEMTTEGLQEIVDIAARSYIDENYDSLGPEAISRITNAAASGLLVGSVFGAGAGSVARDRTTRPDGTVLDPVVSPPLEEATAEVERFGAAVTGVEPGSLMDEIVQEARQDPTARVPASPDPGIRMTKKQAQRLMGEELARSLQLDKYSWQEKWLENLWQVAEKNPHVEPLQAHVNAVRDTHEAQRFWIAKADERVREWEGLGKEQAKKLGDFMLDLTDGVYIEPARTKTGKIKIRGGLPVLSEERPPTQDEVAALVEKYGLSEEALQVYGHIRQDFDGVVDKLEELEVQDAMLTDDPVLAEATRADIAAEYARLRGGIPYFPMARFGDYSVVVRNKHGFAVDVLSFETEREQARAAKALEKEYPADHRITMRKVDNEGDGTFRGLPPEMLRQLTKKLSLSPAQQNALDQAIVEASPARSFRKNLAKRRRVPGFSRDALRSYGHYMQRSAGFLARLEHGRRIQDAIDRMGDNINAMAKAGPSVPLNRREEMKKFMEHHRDYMFNPAGELNGLKAATFHWMLGGAPDSAFMNLTQVPMVTWPRLSRQFDTASASAELLSAYKDTRQLYEKGDMSKIPEHEVRAIEEGVLSGRIEENQASDLAGIVEGDNLSRILPGNWAHRAARQMGYYSSFMFQAMEKYNRRVTYRAAYRLGMKNPEHKAVREQETRNPTEFKRLLERGFTHDQARAVMLAKDTVSHTQFDYAREFRPRFMQGKKGAIFTFFNYTQNMLWHMRHSPGGMRTFLMLAALAGASGLPGAEDVAALVKMMSKWAGGHFDADKAIREVMTEVEAGDYADLLINGVARDIGGFDLSKRVGMGRIVPGGQELAGLLGGEDFDRALARTAENVAGAPGSMVSQPLKALLSKEADSWLLAEKMVPRSLGNVSKMVRRGYRGFESTQTGERIAHFDWQNPQHLAELAGTGLGFNPRRLSARWDRKMQEGETVRFWQSRRDILMKQLHHAKVVVNDREATADVKKAIKRYNKTVPYNSLKFTDKEILQSVEARALNRRKRELGVGGAKRFIPLRRDIQQLHPEDAIEIEDVK